MKGGSCISTSRLRLRVVSASAAAASWPAPSKSLSAAITTSRTCSGNSIAVSPDVAMPAHPEGRTAPSPPRSIRCPRPRAGVRAPARPGEPPRRRYSRDWRGRVRRWPCRRPRGPGRCDARRGSRRERPVRRRQGRGSAQALADASGPERSGERAANGYVPDSPERAGSVPRWCRPAGGLRPRLDERRPWCRAASSWGPGRYRLDTGPLDGASRPASSLSARRPPAPSSSPASRNQARASRSEPPAPAPPGPARRRRRPPHGPETYRSAPRPHARQGFHECRSGARERCSASRSARRAGRGRHRA